MDNPAHVRPNCGKRGRSKNETKDGGKLKKKRKKREVVSNVASAAQKHIGLTLACARDPAVPGRHVFFPLRDDAAAIDGIVNSNRVVYIRAGVAAGKSTMAKFLCHNLEKYIQIQRPIVEGARAISQRDWEDQIVQSYKDVQGENTETSSSHLRHFFPDKCKHALEFFASNEYTLVFDEGHLLLKHGQLVTTMCEVVESLRVLLFSASEILDEDVETDRSTHKGISKILWTPTLPATAVVMEQLRQLQSTAMIQIDEQSIELIFNFCAGNFGVVTAALRWISYKQKQHRQKWDYTTTLKAFRDSIARGWSEGKSLLNALASCRAIKANGKYKSLKNIPHEFCKILFAGPTNSLSEKVKRELTVRGMILPQPDSQKSQFADDNDAGAAEQLMLFDWETRTTKFRVAHPLMGWYYRDMFSADEKFQYKSTPRTQVGVPVSCLDMLARVVPHLSFARIISAPTRNVAGSMDVHVSRQKKRRGSALENNLEMLFAHC